MGYQSIVVGTDGSSTAEQAIRQAAAFAVRDDVRLVVVTAYTTGDAADLEAMADGLPEDIRFTLTDRVQAEELAERGRALAKAAGATKVVVQATPGEPADALLAAAEDFGADLIVVGSRGLNSQVHFILGSVAASVAHHAPCDVLVAHTTN